MRFALHYRGPLMPHKAGRFKDVHRLRLELEPQLRALARRTQFGQKILDGDLDQFTEGESPLVTSSCERRFFPLVQEIHHSQRSKLTGYTSLLPNPNDGRLPSAELRVTMLRPGPPGRILAGGGDIDNRLKTLFDALHPPKHQKDHNFDDLHVESEPEPIVCLLRDDSQVISIAVETSELLDPDDDDEVLLLIDVTTYASPILAHVNMDS